MKLHRNLALGIIKGLKEILLNKRRADAAIEHLLQSDKRWGARDRNFIASNIYDLIRFKRLYEFCSASEADSENSLWKMLGAKLLIEKYDLPDWKEFKELNAKEILMRFENAQVLRKVRESIPDWMDELGEKELGERWTREITALNTAAKLCLRVNTLKTDKSTLKEHFKTEDIGFIEVEGSPDALVIDSKRNLRQSVAYKNGLFEIQDVSSQLVAPFLEPEPGMKVIDGCAGAGGKTLHMAALMRNQSLILAVDVSDSKLTELQRRADRAGCSLVKTMNAGLLKSSSGHYNNYADRILLDVPCSGIGVLRRKPDAKWQLSLQFIEDLKKTQAEILDYYALMLKPGGYLVYSTCSILPSENELQVQKFLQRNMNSFMLVNEKNISPAQSGFDGFYMAKMRRVEI